MTLTTIFMMPENSIIAEKLKTIFTNTGNRTDGWVEYCSRGLQLRRQRIEVALVRLAATVLAAGPKEKMGLMAQDSSLEKQAKKQLKKIKNRKSGIRNRKRTILPLAFRKP